MDGQTTVIINGKHVGVKFTIYGIQEMAKIKGVNFAVYDFGEKTEKVNDVNSLSKNILAMVWGGIQGHAFAKQTDAEVSFEEVSDWLEAMQLGGDASELMKINQAFESSQVYEKVIKATVEKETKPEETKKKLVGKRSGSSLLVN